MHLSKIDAFIKTAVQKIDGSLKSCEAVLHASFAS